MQLELANYDRSSTTNDLNHTIFIATEKKFNAVALPPHYIAEAASLIPSDSQLKIISPVDFPYGQECNLVRLNAIAEASKRGVSIVEVTINNSWIIDQKIKQIAEDINACNILCKAKSIELRAMIEYRLFEINILLELVRKLYSCGVQYITLSTGTFMDDPTDNMLAATAITTKTKAKVICNAPFRTLAQIETFKKTGIYGMRFNSSIIVEKLFTDLKNGV